ncbi:uncharacterized protein TEOVI_000651100 [Trypanosoma equiperdum]|uniref:Uncharacterized protein n=2 Tax=Trypanozoon TaxID=39700 RepID=Q38BA1_TRYB2|nr:hypothetical protein, conserved [Trypanosoma brucei brucei TREU927]EAN77919.1 hypothetical protein, conserved [Trypanosoma brucei brucei TREU927]SCU65134.1 hypothetical protein, conserved [Trypanosoma equiperdum]
MTALSNEEMYVAKAAVEENKRLYKLLNGLSKRDEIVEESAVANSNYGIFSLQRRNEVLKNDINELENQLDDCDVGYTDTVLEYNRLKERRGHLRNETQSLRNILSHQFPKVREAERLEMERKKIKETSEEKNVEAKDEAKRLKEMKEKEMSQVSVLLRKETHLQEKLDKMILPLDTTDRQAIRSAISAADRTIQRLKVEINKYQSFRQPHQSTRADDADCGLAKLREEYYALREKLDMLHQDASM